MNNEQQPVVVNLPQGQDTLTILQGVAPAQLDQKAPRQDRHQGCYLCTSELP